MCRYSNNRYPGIEETAASRSDFRSIFTGLLAVSTAFVTHKADFLLITYLTLRVPPRVFSGVACMRRPGTSAARRTGAGSAGQIQCAGQKVDELKWSPSFFFKHTFRLCFQTKHTFLRTDFHFHTSWLTLRPEQYSPLISKASPGPGSNARARAVPWNLDSHDHSVSLENRTAK